MTDVDTVIVEEQLGTHEERENEAEAPDGRPVVEKVSVGGAPDVSVRVTVEVVDWPCFAEPDEGETEMSNLNAVMERVKVVELDVPPPEALTVTE